MFTVGDFTYDNHAKYAESDKQEDIDKIIASIIKDKPENYTRGDQLYLSISSNLTGAFSASLQQPSLYREA